MSEQQSPKPGSKSAKVLKFWRDHPDWSVPRIAKKLGCGKSTVFNAISKWGNKVGTPKEARPIDPPKTKKKVVKKKAVKKAEPKADPGKLPGVDAEGAMRGGNGKIDYKLKVDRDDVRKHDGPIEGLDGVTMSFTVIDGSAAADLREAQAFMSSIRATLEGLETIEKQMEDHPTALNFFALQTGNMLNAAKRVSDKFLEVAKKREDYRKEHPAREQRATAEWKAEMNRVEPEAAATE